MQDEAQRGIGQRTPSVPRPAAYGAPDGGGDGLRGGVGQPHDETRRVHDHPAREAATGRSVGGYRAGRAVVRTGHGTITAARVRRDITLRG
ncbi:hypothetical protein GCM10010365_17350 [Streptomyces poonensis]|uniref:Uncharacterized protein n=1 Tax=Streptomyces poonensis TaxID=68255 RepID=A0A918PD19_9ACTN|nr:hypothetical protein GCM10010365_17350 [Streptomyces poonensis]